MGTYTAKTRNIGKRPRSKRLRELGGTVINNSGAMPDLSGCELVSNKVTAVDSESTDVQYPSAKCLYDALADIGDAIAALDEVFSAIGHVHAIADITGLQAALDGKAAADHTHSQYLTAHQTVTNKAATIGTSLTTIATIGGTDITAKIDTAAQTSHTHVISDITNLQTTLDGKAASNHTHAITDTTGTLPISRGGTGKTTGADACNALLNSLSIGDSNPVDNDYYISQYVNGGTTNTTYYRRPVSKLWNYIKSKADSIYAAASHTHSYLPLSGGTLTGKLTMKAAIAFAGTKATNDMIVFIDNTADTYGNGIAIGGGGQTIIGGGESAAAMKAQAGSAGAETMWIGNDGNIEFYPNLQSGWAYGKKSYLDTNGDFHVNRDVIARCIALSHTTITTDQTAVLNVSGVCTSSAGTGTTIYGLKASISATAHGAATESAAIFGVATVGYAGKFSGSVKVSSTLTANSISAATIYQTSDDRLKNYVGEFHFALADLERIPLRFFTFKNDPDKRVLIGTSAQAVQKVLPEIVGGSRTASEEDSEEYLNVDYSKLALVALDCVRQLRDEVAALRREIDELKRGR